jgi:hypothetical protein
MADSPGKMDALLTVELDAATRRRVERLAARGRGLGERRGDLLLQLALEHAEPGGGRQRCRLRPRSVGFGFDARAKQL